MASILFLLGNRDLQIKANHQPHALIEKYFIAQNDGEDLVINKAYNAGFRFDEAAQAVLNAYKELKTEVSFPMITATLKHLKLSKPRLLFCASRQSPPHSQDSYPFAEFAALFFSEQGFETQVCLFPQNPNDFAGLVEYFAMLFMELGRTGGAIYVSNSGGTPNMRAASHFAGMFRGFTYVHVNSFSMEVTESTYRKQEEMVLREIIRTMLYEYDYEGIARLPVSENTKEFCRRAIDLYNLNTPYITEETTYEKRAVRALELMYSNLMVCYRKGAFVETIQRIFRIEEAIGQLLFYRLLDAVGLVDDQDQIKSSQPKYIDKSIPFTQLLSDRNEKAALVNQHFSSALQFDTWQGDLVAYFKFYHANPVPLQAVVAGKPFYYFLFRSLNLHADIYDFWQRPNQDYDQYNNPLAELRNQSLAGHGFLGVGRNDLERVTGHFSIFSEQLKNQLSVLAGRPIEHLFEQCNRDIEKGLAPISSLYS
jgi:hypothetical protein